MGYAKTFTVPESAINGACDMKKRYGFALLILVMALVACGEVAEEYHLQAGESLPEDHHLVVVDAYLEQDSVVEGDLNITASSVEIDNTIQGDLTVLAASLIVGQHTTIDGDLIYCVVNDGDFVLREGAVIWGEVRDSCQDDDRVSIMIAGNNDATPLLRVGGAIVLSLVAGVTASLGTILFPRQMTRISLVAHEHRRTSFGIGAFTMLIVLGLSALYVFSLAIVVSILLVPFVIIIWLGLIAVIGFGSVSVAMPFGVWLMRLFKRDEHIPLVTATLGAFTGTFLITIVSVFDPFIYVTLFIGVLICAWALGAALLTRVGTRIYRTQ